MMLQKSGYESLFAKLLRILDISESKLAKAINVDPSLVSRWINGKRIISLKSNYIELITEYIYQNIKDDCQKELIIELFTEIYPDAKLNIKNIKNYIYRFILIQQKNLLSKEKSISYNNWNWDNNSDSLHMYSDKKGTPISIKGSKKSFDKQVPSQQIGFYKFITGHQNVINEIFNMLKSAKYLSIIPEKPILTTFLNNMHITQGTNKVLEDLHETVFDLLENGWNITAVGLINYNLINYKIFKDFILRILPYDNFKINYMSKYGVMKYPCEIIVVPEIGALTCFHSLESSEISNGFVFKDEKSVEIITQQYEYILNQSTPLIKNYSIERKMDFALDITKLEEKTGNQFVYKDYPSDITVPSYIFRKYLERTFNDEKDFNMHMSCYEKKLNSFLSQIGEYNYFEIYSKKSLEEYIKNKQYRIYGFSTSKIIPVTSNEIIKHMENIINILEKYKNYNIILLNDVERISALEIFLMIKQGCGLFFEFIHTNNSYTVIDNPLKDINNVSCGLISESTFVNKTADIFLDFWHGLPTIRRDKRKVISWFRTKLDEMNNL